MKKSLIYFSAIMLGVAGAAALTSCDDNWEYPPMVVPQATIEANTTIDRIKADFFQSGTNNYAVLVGEKADGSHYIIEGIVTTSDESGNYFKQIVIQDETGAIQLDVDAYDLYLSYQVGQKIVLDVTGLYIGGYGRLMQIGAAPSSGYPSRIPEDTFTKYAQIDGLASSETMVKPQVISMAELSSTAPDSPAGLSMQNLLITVEGVTFENAGKQTLSTSGSNGVSQTIRNAEGSAILYTSGYSDFWDYYCPTGTGNITGILSCYNATWQIRLIDIEGLEGFDELSKQPTQAGPAETVTTLNETFEDGSIPDNWVQVQVAGDKSWYATSFDNNYYAAMTGYKGTAPFDQWLITPPIDMDAASVKNLSFRTQVNGYSSTTSKFEVYVITNTENPAQDAVLLKPQIATAPASGYSTWANSGLLDLSEFKGTVYIGFRYSATTDANYATWCLDDVIVNGPASGN